MDLKQALKFVDDWLMVRVTNGMPWLDEYKIDTAKMIVAATQPPVQADAGNCPLRCKCLESTVECFNLQCLDRSTA